MTVIVYDGTSLAADRRRLASNSDILCAPANKLTVVPAGAMATAGDARSEATKKAVINRIAGGATTGLDNEISGLVLLATGAAFLVHGGDALPMSAPHAIGSGHEVARGAMAAGVSARRAVEITNDLVVTCGDGVDVYTPEKAA